MFVVAVVVALHTSIGTPLLDTAITDSKAAVLVALERLKKGKSPGKV
jgi:hypothetical protein